MCWSAEVSMFFGAADLAALTMLCHRNEKRDRLYAMAAAPIVGQELMSVVLWTHIGAGPMSCTDSNVGVSLFVVILVTFLPLTWVIFAIKGSDWISDKLRSWTTPAIGMAAAYVILRVGLAIAGFAMGANACTYPGPNGHQVWPNYLEVFQMPILSWLLLFFYVALPVGALAVFMKPRWVGLSIIAIFVGTLVPIRLTLLQEWTSVWCWSAAAILVFALAEPYLRRVFGPSARREAV